jgi:hypothetical protein
MRLVLSYITTKIKYFENENSRILKWDFKTRDHQFAVVAKSCILAPNICRSSVSWNLLRVTILAPIMLRWLVNFREICALMI